MKYQPRYLAYCNANGLTPEEQLERDRAAYPGGCMCGYILWISHNLSRFRAHSPSAFLGNALHDQDGFTSFLAQARTP